MIYVEQSNSYFIFLNILPKFEKPNGPRFKKNSAQDALIAYKL